MIAAVHDDQRDEPDAPRIHAVSACSRSGHCGARWRPLLGAKFPTSAGFLLPNFEEGHPKVRNGDLDTRTDLRTPKEGVCLEQANLQAYFATSPGRLVSMPYESWVERQIREATERGEFDNLPGQGEPIKGLNGREDRPGR